jgi:hypothetical protein
MQRIYEDSLAAFSAVMECPLNTFNREPAFKLDTTLCVVVVPSNAK